MPTPTPKVMSAEAQNLVRRPNFAHLASVRANGSPKLDPVWIDLVDPSTVIMATGRESLKTQNVERDPRVAISIVDIDNPYEELQMRGTCVVEPDADMAVLDALSHKYTGKPFPARSDTGVALRITVTQYLYQDLPFEHTPPQE
ncbi:MAG: PPOX class F420-dependent oxidoreductase [Acidimicrobiales bacterium]|nr:PPOX class F420-dependent oxidoreductase [Acidimicrobiaceae bacterium]MYA26609.1 PPOX class F420-dependent oxidoreductase [Acidimicrobiales bacterium]MYD82415.1 PPOX class F420-dependent oxidoreductase [Acidimicrobiales bacterium]MYJ66064.1 PPOX class F420-dependent oxidoreductase [Acidimicrobiales bacterium]